MIFCKDSPTEVTHMLYMCHYVIFLSFVCAICTDAVMSPTLHHATLPRQFSSVLGRDHTRCRYGCCSSAAAAAADARI